MDEIKIEQLVDSVVITIPREKKHTIEDLRQKLINYLYDSSIYDNCKVELIKVLFETKKD